MKSDKQILAELFKKLRRYDAGNRPPEEVDLVKRKRELDRQAAELLKQTEMP